MRILAAYEKKLIVRCFIVFLIQNGSKRPRKIPVMAPLSVVTIRLDISSHAQQRPLKMRLLTHNMLQCQVKGCDTNNFPLELHVDDMNFKETEFNAEFTYTLLSKLDWPALCEVVKKVLFPNSS